MTMVLLWAGLAYLLIGLYLATVGVLGQDIRKEISAIKARAEAASFFDAKLTAPVPRWKMLLFALLLGTGAVLCWIVFLPGYLAGRRRERLLVEAFENQGLRFSAMAGAGRFLCLDCGYSQALVAFVHGFAGDGWSRSGFQCRGCHQFREVEATHAETPELKCVCGGELTRDERVVCPECKSDHVDYRAEIIT